MCLCELGRTLLTPSYLLARIGRARALSFRFWARPSLLARHIFLYRCRCLLVTAETEPMYHYCSSHCMMGPQAAPGAQGWHALSPLTTRRRRRVDVPCSSLHRRSPTEYLTSCDTQLQASTPVCAAASVTRQTCKWSPSNSHTLNDSRRNKTWMYSRRISKSMTNTISRIST